MVVLNETDRKRLNLLTSQRFDRYFHSSLNGGFDRTATSVVTLTPGRPVEPTLPALAAPKAVDTPPYQVPKERAIIIHPNFTHPNDEISPEPPLTYVPPSVPISSMTEVAEERYSGAAAPKSVGHVEIDVANERQTAINYYLRQIESAQKFDIYQKVIEAAAQQAKTDKEAFSSGTEQGFALLGWFFSLYVLNHLRNQSVDDLPNWVGQK